MCKVLAIDVGNTAAKGFVYDGDEIVESVVSRNDDLGSILEMAFRQKVGGAIFCSVSIRSEAILSMLTSSLAIPVKELTKATPLPIGIEYKSRATLGVDRIASAVGAYIKYGGNSLVVDAGTAVTTDLVVDGAFRGGNISPGLRLRFESLHQYTSRLPLVESEGDIPAFGYDTVTAIRSGVVGGLISEITESYRIGKEKYKEIKLIITGGDAEIIVSELQKRGIESVVDHTLVATGLIGIYNYDENE